MEKTQYNILRDQEIALIRQQMPEHQQRLKWTRAQIEQAQQNGLRELLAYAKQHSPWHAKRLSRVNDKSFTLNELHSLPTMTKIDVMENWDAIVTDKDLSLAKANAFLEQLKPEQPQLFQGRYHIHATGGSSGLRGVFAWDIPSVATFVDAFFRYQWRDDFSHCDGKQPLSVAVLTADHPIHMSTPVFSVPLVPAMQIHLVYATWPMQQIIAKLNEIQPSHLIGYTSVIHRLAEDALLRGTLKIKPRRASVNSEPLFENSRKLIEKAWGIPITNMWGSTDCGPHAVSCDFTRNLHLTEDLLIFEPVNKQNNPVAYGQEADKLLITNLLNRTMPLIRYEIEDRVRILNEFCACGAQYRLVKEIKGRMDDDFLYDNGAVISTEIFETPLYASGAVEEYQVVQTTIGANVFVVVNDKPFDRQALLNTLKKSYEEQGIKAPQININVVEKLQRNPLTGKLRRDIPLKP